MEFTGCREIGSGGGKDETGFWVANNKIDIKTFKKDSSIGVMQVSPLLESYDLVGKLSAESLPTRELSRERKSFLGAPDKFRFSTGHRRLFSCSFWYNFG